MPRSKRSKSTPQKSTKRNSRSTVSGPAQPDGSGRGDALAEKTAASADLAAALPYNPLKAYEYDPEAALAPKPGPSVKPRDPLAGASTVSESNGSDKVGSGAPLAVGASDRLLAACGIDAALPNGQPDPGVIRTPDASKASDRFIAAIAKHRHLARETDPPRV